MANFSPKKEILADGVGEEANISTMYEGHLIAQLLSIMHLKLYLTRLDRTSSSLNICGTMELLDSIPANRTPMKDDFFALWTERKNSSWGERGWSFPVILNADFRLLLLMSGLFVLRLFSS